MRAVDRVFAAGSAQRNGPRSLTLSGSFSDGRVAHSLKKAWRDGSTHVVLAPQVLIERLLALVPRPRRHLVTYHGVRAPGASLRHRAVPQADEDGEQVGLAEPCADSVEARSDEVAAGAVAQSLARVPHRPGKWRCAIRRYYTWADTAATAGYYSQYRVDMLEPKRTVLEEALDTDAKVTEQAVRTLLGSFLFSGESVFKKVSVLSGGEKSRLALVKLLVNPPNLLLMDEPTMHLDITSVDALVDALRTVNWARTKTENLYLRVRRHFGD